MILIFGPIHVYVIKTIHFMAEFRSNGFQVFSTAGNVGLYIPVTELPHETVNFITDIQLLALLPFYYYTLRMFSLYFHPVTVFDDHSVSWLASPLEFCFLLISIMVFPCFFSVLLALHKCQLNFLNASLRFVVPECLMAQKHRPYKRITDIDGTLLWAVTQLAGLKHSKSCSIIFKDTLCTSKVF